MTPFASESSLKSKNGYSRIIPLRTRAMGVLKSLPKTEEEFTWQCLDSSGHDAGPLLFVCITQPFASPRLIHQRLWLAAMALEIRSTMTAPMVAPTKPPP